MLSKSMIVVALSLAVLCTSIGNGADKGVLNTPKEGAGEHPLYKYWVYRTRVDDKNNAKTEARVLHLREKPSSLRFPQFEIEGWMWRYERAGNSGNYHPKKFGHPPVAKVHLEGVGISIESNAGSSRQRRIEFGLEGTYESSPTTTKVIKLKGYFHPGSNTTPANTVNHPSRLDDRLAVRVVTEREVAKSAACADSLSLKTVLRITELLSEAKNKDKSRSLISTLIKMYLKTLPDPCEAQPDDDVMEEEALAADPETDDPDPEVPTEP